MWCKTFWYKKNMISNIHDQMESHIIILIGSKYFDLFIKDTIVNMFSILSTRTFIQKGERVESILKETSVISKT